MSDFMPLGRSEPGDWAHVEKYPLQAATPAEVNRVLRYSYWWKKKYDQGQEGACVGFASSQMMSVLNRHFYDAFWLYHRAQEVDEWPGIDYSGTSVRAAMDILRDVGHRRIYRGLPRAPRLVNGIAANRWAVSVDEIRDSIRRGVPVTMGTNWYQNFDRPVKVNGIWRVGLGDLGKVRGGHAWCIIGASDKKQAVLTPNSWGKNYPSVWIPYGVVARLLRENGEATVVTDR